MTGFSPDASFTDRIHQALAAYHADDALAATLGELCVVAARLARQPVRGLAAAARAVLDEALDRLAETAPKMAELLVERFVKGKTARATAYALSYSERAFFTRQKEAIAALGRVLWEAEQALQCEALLRPAQQAALESLPPPTFSRLFGVSERLAQLGGFLRSDAAHWLVAVDGMGGMGKTALARAAAGDLVAARRFSRVIWVTAQQQMFAWSRMEGLAGPALTYAGLLAEIARVLGDPSGAALGQDEQERRLRPALAASPTLLVVDNLETAADVEALVQGLHRLARPTKVLLTTRRRVSAYEQVTSLTLRELSPADARALARYHAEERNVPAALAASEDELARLVHVTDGNPLAIKLVIGQLLALPLNQVLTDLAAARPDTHDFYRFLFRYAWERLSQPARHLLLHMPLLDVRGTTWEDLAAVSGVALNGHFRRALEELFNTSLLNAGYVQGRLLYSIHRLTEYFILSDLVGPRPEGPAVETAATSTKSPWGD